MTESWTLRALCGDDCESVRTIFNHYIAHSFAAYTADPKSSDDIQDMLKQTEGLPAFAAIAPDSTVIGFSFLRPYSSNQTFAGTALLTTFVAKGYTGRRLGTALLEQIETAALQQEIRHILAHVSSLNEGSQAFHQRHGYVPCGRFHDIGSKFGKSFDVVWFEKALLPEGES